MKVFLKIPVFCEEWLPYVKLFTAMKHFRMIYCISNGTIRHGVQYLILKYIWPPIFVISLSPDSINSSMMTIVCMIVKDLVMMIKDHDDYGLIWSQPV